MNTPLSDLITALDNIDRKYYQMQNVAFKNGILEFDSDEELKSYERRFMMEFAVQYSKIFVTDADEIYKGTQRDFEIPKKFMYYRVPDITIKETFERLSKKEYKKNSSSEVMSQYFTTIPDFLIHKSQNNSNEKFQKLIVEAKTNPNPSKVEIFKDIFHINIYAEKYNYQNSVILLINYTKEKWLADLRSYLANRYYLASVQNQHRIFVVFKENYEMEPTINSLVGLKTICQHRFSK
ncbi:hypothetical protein [Autumnicola musiva]|uniref:Uncharacterized protein n=1 Tax=Autumnicola musiva TaxID=3075589 RepID=A0ABU3D636_9FLAO|nr:hypothetical protein [Zunongwangia sp. F117]MDT0676473.1 hypothetical protein [Zunongwangia sp. F117]